MSDTLPFFFYFILKLIMKVTIFLRLNCFNCLTFADAFYLCHETVKNTVKTDEFDEYLRVELKYIVVIEAPPRPHHRLH